MPRPSLQNIAEYREEILQWLASRRYGSSITQLMDDLKGTWTGLNYVMKSPWSTHKARRYTFHTRHRLRRMLMRLVAEGLVEKQKRTQDQGDLFLLRKVQQR